MSTPSLKASVLVFPGKVACVIREVVHSREKLRLSLV